MINVAIKKQVENDICLADMGDGLFFRPGTFDAAIRLIVKCYIYIKIRFLSISALQWLCNADKSYHEPRKRLNKFFQTLHNCLAK